MLKTHDLAVARGGVPILAGLNLAVAPGAALVLRGANGSGKTTLLRTIAGLQPPHAGRVEVDPEILTYAAHSDGLKSVLTVTENLNFWARVYGNRDISVAMDGFDLTALQDRPAGSLSAGQKRRLGLARLLVSGRKLWILDEPTVSLDAASVALFAAAVTAHLAAGGAALMATHIDLGLSAEVLDVTPFRARAEHAAFGGDW